MTTTLVNPAHLAQIISQLRAAGASDDDCAAVHVVLSDLQLTSGIGWQSLDELRAKFSDDSTRVCWTIAHPRISLEPGEG